MSGGGGDSEKSDHTSSNTADTNTKTEIPKITYTKLSVSK
ncbi:hypothetical protein ANASTE_00279 [Anaerofustis stercorihominis DSM 17244]|uniref:Uncharacterized protein n=2 Tax=Anaerofustis stercorihominis TaxID=214853 RepID=B1C6D9_9FIRM|nr:hypothetical protein ANASTE_00279 [Anaerofustis stercorihominis DSM 17244]